LSSQFSKSDIKSTILILAIKTSDYIEERTDNLVNSLH